MVCGVSAHAAGHLGAAEVGGDLIYVDLNLEAHLFCLVQVILGILDVEYALLSEDVGELGEISLLNLRHNLREHIVDEFSFFALPLRKYAVGAEEGADYVHGMSLIQFLVCLQHADLGVMIHTVAGLAFHSGDAELQHPVQTLAAKLHEFFLGSCSGGNHGGVDAAASLHDGHVGVALQPPAELIGAVAAEKEVSVGIYEAGKYGLAGGIDDLIVLAGHFLVQLFGGAHSHDLVVMDENAAVLDQSDIRHFFAVLRCGASAGYQLGGMADVTLFHRNHSNLFIVLQRESCRSRSIHNDYARIAREWQLSLKEMILSQKGVVITSRLLP